MSAWFEPQNLWQVSDPLFQRAWTTHARSHSIRRFHAGGVTRINKSQCLSTSGQWIRWVKIYFDLKYCKGWLQVRKCLQPSVSIAIIGSTNGGALRLVLVLWKCGSCCDMGGLAVDKPNCFWVVTEHLKSFLDTLHWISQILSNTLTSFFL